MRVVWFVLFLWFCCGLFFPFKASYSCRQRAVAIWMLLSKVREHVKWAWQSNFLDLDVPIHELLPV